jgi:hypothetical protein
MRPLLIAASTLMAASLFVPSHAAAQDPDTSPPPPGRPADLAVPRAGEPSQVVPPPPAPEPPRVAEERRGAVRAPERTAERPARVDAPGEGPSPRKVITEDVAAPRAATATAETPRAADDQRGQRRGSVRQPPRDGDASRPRDRAVPRVEAPRPPRTTVVRSSPYRYYPNYPNYTRYYDPWGYGSFGLGYFYYSPWAWGPYGTYGYPAYYPRYGGSFGFDVGSVKLKVKPRDAEVWVDGYYAGTVDDFDGIFQALKLDSGPYRIEIRKPGYETLSFDVRVQPQRTITFRGVLRPVP